MLLVEQALTVADARQVLSLHEELDDPVVYHVLLPLEDAAARIEASMGTLSGGELMGNPTLGMHEVDVEAVRKDAQERSHEDLVDDAAGAARGGRHGRGQGRRRRPHRRAGRRGVRRSTGARRSS